MTGAEMVVMGEPPRAELLRRLALNDDRTITSMLSPNAADDEAIELVPKAAALFRIAALIASESAFASYKWAVTTALAEGASDDDIVAVLVSVAPIVGSARLSVAASALASALGYELDPLTDN